jgi:hypothetical protein
VTAYDSTPWSGFAFAQVGASAALLGLVVVGLSINLRELIASRPVVNRGAEAVVLLGSVLVTATPWRSPIRTMPHWGANSWRSRPPRS